MAIFLAVADPDAARREAVLTKFAGADQPWSELAATIEQCGHLGVAWAASKNAPVSVERTPDTLGLLIGDALVEETRLTGSDLLARWAGDEMMPPLDGLHIGLRGTAHGELLVGADLLGLLPVHYWTDGRVVLVGSSVDSFRHHPSFRETLDLEGLAGLLLLGHAFGGRSLARGVRRLGAGHLLRSSLATGPREIPQYRVTPNASLYDLPFSAQCDLAFQALDRAVRRHASHAATAMLLSGGRDSRMLAGLLARNGKHVQAITLGRADDIESRCAVGVARALHFRQQQVDILPAEYPAAAERMARWEHVESGFHYCDPWALPPRLGGAPGPLVSGLVMDAILGGSHIAWAHEPRTGALGFEPFFARANRLAFSPAAIEQLLADPRGRDVVWSVLGEIRTAFEGLADTPARRAWCFDLYHRQRFYVGRAAWAWSFGAWPVLPAVDRGLLETCAGLPAASLADRRLQDAILCEELPALAELPLDRNGFDSSPLQPRLRSLAVDHLRRRARRLGLLPAPTLERDWDRLYFYRAFAIQSRGWATVRNHAEPHRERLYSVLGAEPLRRALPAPDVPIATDDMILDSARSKLLLGLILWAREHL